MKKKPHVWLRIFIGIPFLMLAAALTAGGIYLYHRYGPEVKELQAEAKRIAKESLPEDFRTEETTLFYTADGQELETMSGGRDSFYLSAEQIPEDVRAAVCSIEDKRFYEHKGVDYRGVLRAVRSMIENGEPTQGGSTITQQLARNLYLTTEKTWQRKLEEIFLALELEKKYTKDQILEFYLNNIYFANGYYGIEAASRGYFQKCASQLSLSETAYLLAIPNSPTYYDPLTFPEHTLERRNLVLKNMYEDGLISQIDYRMALSEEIQVTPPVSSKSVYAGSYARNCAVKALMELKGFPFVYNHSMRASLQNKYDEEYGDMYASCQRDLFTGGYRVYTSLDLSVQEELQEAVDAELQDFQEVNEEGIYTLQSAGACIDNQTGRVIAVSGGRSQTLPGFPLNRAYQSFRQPGSAIKPLIVYTPALERGYSPDTVMALEDITEGSPVSEDGSGITLREAVAKSSNTVATNLFRELTPPLGLSYLDEMQFTHISTRDEREAAALGGFTTGCSAVEMTSAFATLENDGYFRDPTCIERITDSEGNILYEPNEKGKEVYRTKAARQMTDMLKTVMESGTGKDLSLPGQVCAGKTGTTNDNKDGWFIGYTGYYTAGIWVGYDMPRSLPDLAGNTYPGRIWQRFMGALHEGKSPWEFLPPMEIPEPEEPEIVYSWELEEEEEPEAEEVPEEVPPQKPLEEMTPEEHMQLWLYQLSQMQGM